MANEPIQGAPYPLGSVPVDVSADIKAVVDFFSPRITMRFASKTALTAAVTSPFVGQEAITTDTNVLWRWTGTQWRHQGIPSFASTTARDSAISQPLAGDRCQVGSAGSWVTYRHDGTAWRGADWTALTLSAGITGGTLEYRLDDGVVEIRSTLLTGSVASGTIVTVVTAANLPSQMRPASGRYIVGQFFDAWGTGTGTAVVSASDGLQVKQSSGGTLTGNMAISFRYRV